MKEKDLYRAVDKHLPATILRTSLTGAAMTGNGIPDRLYVGKKRLLFIEYKQLKAMPRDRIARAALTPLQLRWVNHLFAATQNAIVVVGLPNRTAVMMRAPSQWENGHHVSNAVPIKEVSEWITEYCGG